MIGFSGVMILLVAAWIAHERNPETQMVRAAERACQDWDLEEFDAYHSAYEAGDPSAARCRLALERAGDLADADYATPPELWLGQGYWIWRATGEPVEEALAAARTMPRGDVVARTHDMEAYRGGPQFYSWDATGCPILNDIQIELVRVARPDERTRRCLDNWGLEDGSSGG